MFGSRNTTGAISMPAIAPMPAAMPQPSAIIQEVLMPTSRADSGTEAAARIASPIRVYWKKKESAISTRNGEEPKGVGYCLMVKSQIRPAQELMIENSAMKPATLVSTGAFSSGLNKVDWIAMPAAKEKASVRTKAIQ